MFLLFTPQERVRERQRKKERQKEGERESKPKEPVVSFHNSPPFCVGGKWEGVIVWSEFAGEKKM